MPSRIQVEDYFDTSELNVPATFILTQGEGRIVYKHAKRDYTKRAPGSEKFSVKLALADFSDLRTPTSSTKLRIL